MLIWNSDRSKSDVFLLFPVLVTCSVVADARCGFTFTVQTRQPYLLIKTPRKRVNKSKRWNDYFLLPTETFLATWRKLRQHLLSLLKLVLMQCPILTWFPFVTINMSPCVMVPPWIHLAPFWLFRPRPSSILSPPLTICYSRKCSWNSLYFFFFFLFYPDHNSLQIHHYNPIHIVLGLSLGCC